MGTSDRTRFIAGAARAHSRLLEHLRSAEFDPVRPSLLPDWTVGHVLTHIARNAEGLAGFVAAAAGGRLAYMYPGGLAQRNGDIESGAGRSREELIDDIATWSARLDEAFATATDAAWEVTGERMPGVGPLDAGDTPFMRWREVEVHHSDLGIKGFTFEDWDAEYVRLDLARQEMVWASRKPMGMTQLPADALNLAPITRLAWLTGRITPAGLEPVQFP